MGWVSDCIPKNDRGFPGSVFGFLHEYGVPDEECIPNYGDLDSGHCPSLCVDGESLAGHLKRPSGVYHVIFDGVVGAYTALGADKHKIAKQHIFNDGPIVGFVLKTEEVAACARDDRIIYQNDCGADDGAWNTN